MWKFFGPAIAVISLMLFCSSLGAKIGGGLTAVLGLSITVRLWLKQPIHLREIGKLILVALLALLATGVWEYTNRNGMSHLGQLLLGIKKEGIGLFSAMVLRKLKLNWRLIQYTPLAFILIGILVAVPFLYKYPSAFIQEKIAQYPEITSGFTGLCITALFALLLNDTGIVAATMMFAYGMAMFLLIAIKDRPA